MATKKKQKAPEPFVARSVVGEAILAGDVDGVLNTLEQLGPSAWPGLRSEVKEARTWAEHGAWGELEQRNSYGFVYAFSSAPQRLATHKALLVVGSLADATEVIGHDVDEVLAVLRRFRPVWLPELATALVDRAQWTPIDLVQQLVIEGLSRRPTSEAYVLALLSWSSTMWRNRKQGEQPDFYDRVVTDPGLVDDGVLLRLFDIEGNSTASLAVHDKYGKGNSWTEVLLRFIAEGRLLRDVVVDKTLTALERDWPQFRTQWYLHFHEALTITAAEQALHARRYLGLLASRIPPTVGVALDVVMALSAAGVVSAAELLPALLPVVTARGKGQVKAALKLARVAVDDDSRCEAMRLAAAALISDDAAVQAQALAMLRAPLPDDVAAVVREAAPGLAPRHQATVAALVGAVPVVVAALPEALASVARDPLDAARALTVPALDELVEVVAAVLEDDSDADLLERAFAGLVRFQSEVKAAHDWHQQVGDRAPSTWAALRKRALRITTTNPGTLRATLGTLLLAILDDDDVAAPAALASCSDVWQARCHEARAVRAARLVPLATPTHLDGALRASVLLERVQAMQAAQVAIPTVEGQLALYRIVDVTDADIAVARTLGDSDFTRALRCALNDPALAELDPVSSPFALAAVLRRRGPWALSAPPRLVISKRPRSDGGEFVDVTVDITALAEHHPQALCFVRPHDRQWGSSAFSHTDVASALSFWPTGREALFTDGIDSVANNLDWWGAQWHDVAWFVGLRSPWSRCDDAASITTAMLVLGLAGKEPGQVTTAVDALLLGLADGRIVAAAVGHAGSGLLDAGLLKAKRLAAALRRALTPATRPHLQVLVEHLLAGAPTTAPRDIAALLELLVHLRAGVVEPLPAPTRAYIEGLAGGGQLARERKLLLTT